jgi:hypothetical protein
MCFNLVIWTPHGMGHPTNLCPETLTLPIGFLKDTLGAYRRYIHMYQEVVPLR